MTFSRLVVFMVKLSIASIPAAIILWFISLISLLIFLAILSALGMAFFPRVR
jgi:hypothetical protein